jgi:hypothetical protein
MKMSMSGMEGIEMDGRIARCRVDAGHLALDIRLSRPVGWQAGARLSRKDVWNLAWMILKSPAALAYVLFGIGARGG